MRAFNRNNRCFVVFVVRLSIAQTIAPETQLAALIAHKFCTELRDKELHTHFIAFAHGKQQALCSQSNLPSEFLHSAAIMIIADIYVTRITEPLFQDLACEPKRFRWNASPVGLPSRGAQAVSEGQVANPDRLTRQANQAG